MSTTLIVGADQQFHTIAAAITAANTIAGGAIIEIVAGTYVNDGGTITGDNVTIEGVGGFAKLVGASVGSGDFAAITLAGNHDVIANLDVCGVTKGYGIFLQAGTFNTIENVDVHGNQEGIVGGNNPGAFLTITGSDIGYNGTNIDLRPIFSAGLLNSSVHDAQGGDELRTQASQTQLFGDVIADNNSNAAYVIDMPSAGYLGLSNCEIEKGPNSSTSSIISYGTSAGSQINKIAMYQSTLINDVYPNYDNFVDRPGVDVQLLAGSRTWNLPNLGTSAPPTSTTYEVETNRPRLATEYNLDYGQAPAVTVVTGNRDGGVTLAGGSTQPAPSPSARRVQARPRCLGPLPLAATATSRSPATLRST